MQSLRSHHYQNQNLSILILTSNLDPEPPNPNTNAQTSDHRHPTVHRRQLYLERVRGVRKIRIQSWQRLGRSLNDNTANPSWANQKSIIETHHTPPPHAIFSSPCSPFTSLVFTPPVRSVLRSTGYPCIRNSWSHSSRWWRRWGRISRYRDTHTHTHIYIYIYIYIYTHTIIRAHYHSSHCIILSILHMFVYVCKTVWSWWTPPKIHAHTHTHTHIHHTGRRCERDSLRIAHVALYQYNCKEHR